MIKAVFLDTGPLGMIAHPRPNSEITEWLRDLLRAGIQVVLPEIADYEIRRELLRSHKTKSIHRLDQVKRNLEYEPITTEAMLKAAELWAKARRGGSPTSGDKALDGDVILAAQALTYPLGADEILVATSNVGHLDQFLMAQKWQDISF